MYLKNEGKAMLDDIFVFIDSLLQTFLWENGILLSLCPTPISIFSTNTEFLSISLFLLLRLMFVKRQNGCMPSLRGMSTLLSVKFNKHLLK